MQRRSFLKTAGLAALGVAGVSSGVRAADPKTLVIDKIVHHFTPQSAKWCMFTEFKAGDAEEDFKNRDNGGDPCEIKLNLKISDVEPGSECTFKVFLDDNFDEVGSNAEDRAKGTFKASRMGKKNFRYTTKGAGNFYTSAEEGADNIKWHFTIYWHLE